MSQLWLHSDWHWRHENIYRFVYTDVNSVERRVRERFSNATEGDAYMEQRWRDLIKPQDHVYVLGDLTMFRENHMATEFVSLWRSLPGHKRLIPGNHDHLKPRWYVEAGFEKIRGAHLLDNLFLTHVPVHPSSIPRRAIGNVHGHTHQQPDIWPVRREDGTVAAWLNVSVERTGYEPIPVEEAKRLLEACRAAVDLRPVLKDVSNNLITGP